MSGASDFFRQIADALDQMEERPYGPEVEGEERDFAGRCCVQMCNGDPDRGRTLWRDIAHDCGNYFPRAAAVAVIRASNTANLMPDVEAPELT